MLSETEFQNRAQRIKLLLLDVDGVFTEGTILIDDRGTESKHFSVRDGFGIRCWTRSGGRVAVITGRQSHGVAFRCRELGIDPVFQQAIDKWPAFSEVLARCQVAAEEVCALGDDVPDLPLILASGLGVTVADGHPEVQARADWITTSPGGRGAIREVIERLLKVQGKWSPIVDAYASRHLGGPEPP